ncbi:MAG: hypothetical protein LBN37_07020 [Bacteroidales bacterium]|jgi:hypothetical protein|nr:hypothetical protein [Bacteroidales bacterium]
MPKILSKKTIIIATILLTVVAGLVARYVIHRTNNRVQIEVDIHINKQTIYLSTYAEPPQFALWLENPETGECQTIFITYRVSRGDWEGKSDVPVALPRWNSIFRSNSDRKERSAEEIAVSGATPKDEYFRVRAEVRPDSEWILWMEMNLAGDYNEYYPQFNRTTLQEDEFACGQPALLYRANIKATVGNEFFPQIEAISLWDKGKNTLVPLDATITTAKDVFDKISYLIIKPKPVIINTNNIEQQDVLNP